MTDAALQETLRAALPVIAVAFRDPWWIIGSAAMALSGMTDVAPQDIDVLCTPRDAGILSAVWEKHIDSTYRPQDDGRFRSRFARFAHLPMPLEAMGGLEVMTGDGWRPVDVRGSQRIAVAGGEVAVPVVEEQIRILRMFGRDKDLAKAARLTDFLEAASHVA